MSDRWEFFAEGLPQPKGSTKAFMRPGMKFPIVTADNLKTKPWAAVVMAAAREAQAGRPIINGPVAIDLEFVFPRPAGHYRTGARAGEPKPNAPSWHTVKPDKDKLTRAVYDALKGVVYVDDARVCAGREMKRYQIGNESLGVLVRVEAL